MIEQFNAAQRQRGIMTSSITRRAADLRKFDQWLSPGTLLDASVADVEAFLAARGWADQTRYAFLSHLHAYYRWATRQGLVDVDPTEFIDRPRLRPGLPRPVTDDQLAYLLTQATGRMRCWLLLGSFSGLRCLEIAGPAPWRRRRPGRVHACARQGRQGAHRAAPPSRPAFAARAADAPGRSAVGGEVRAAADRRQRVAVGEPVDPRGRCRRDDAPVAPLVRYTRSYQQCQDILAVAGLMGHSNTATTAIYAKFSHRVATAAVLSLTVEPGRDDE